jgi:hypothetical protein
MAGLFSGSPASPGINSAPGGLLDLFLGASNPVAQFADSRQNVLGALGAGIASGPTLSQGLANAAQNIPQARQRDYQMGLYRGQVSQTVKYLQDQHPDIAQQVASGALSPSDGFALAYKQDNQPGVAVSATDVLKNPQTGAVIGGGPTSAFAGTDIKAQAWNMILKGQSDPSIQQTPEYQTAVSIVSQPTTQMVQTPQGMVPTQISPVLPSFMTGGQAQPSGQQSLGNPATVGDAAQSAIASGQVSAGPSVGNMGAVAGKPLPGTAPAPNESQNRFSMLSGMALSDLPTAIANFQALANPKDQVLQKLAGIDPTGLSKGAQDPHFQQAATATQAIISNVLYSVSGAAIGDKEMERKVQDLTPQLGDHTPAIADKLRRLGDYVGQIASTSRDPAQVSKATEFEQQLPDIIGQITKNDPIAVTTPQQAAALPHGSYFKAPDGVIRINP